MGPEIITAVEPVDINPVATEVATEVATSVATPVVTEPVEDKPSFDLEGFNWDDWDGKEDSFPEDAKPYVSKVTSFWKKQLEAQQADDASIKALTKLLSDEEEKPVSQIDDGKVKALEDKIAELTEQLTERESKLTTYEKEMKAREEAEENAWVSKIQSDNPDVFQNEKKTAIVRELIDTDSYDFEIEDAIVLARQTKTVVEKAKEYRKKGAPSNLSVEFAIKDSSGPPKLATADVVEGAGRIVRGSPPERTTVSNANPKQARDNAVEFALRKHS